MNHISYIILLLAIFSACQEDSESVDLDSSVSICEESVEGDYIVVNATDLETGEMFCNLYTNKRFFNHCFQFQRSGSFSDGRDTTTNDYFSKLMFNSFNTEWVDLEFFHGEDCDPNGFQTVISLAIAKIPLGDDTFFLGMSDLGGLNLGLLSAYSAITVEQDASIDNLEFLQFGKQVGDVIEGRVFSESVRPANFDTTGRPEFLTEDDGTRYAVEIKFSLTIEE